jgi:hypothetical protein
VDQINYEGKLNHNGIQYYFINDGIKKNYFPNKLNRFVKELKPDIILVSCFLFLLQVIQLRNCVGKKVKIILQHHAEKPLTVIADYSLIKAMKIHFFRPYRNLSVLKLKRKEEVPSIVSKLISLLKLFPLNYRKL